MSKPFMRKLNPFKPSDYTGCQLWLDGADSTTITISTGVSQLNDKSTNSYNLTQGTTGLQPSYSGNLITFSSNKYLNIPQAAINNTATYSLFLIFNPIASTNWILQKQYNGVSSRTMLSMTRYWQNNTGISNYLYWTSWANSGAIANSTTALSTSTLQLIEVLYDGSTLTMYRNGNVLSTTSSASYGIGNETNATNFTIGSWIADGSIMDSGVTNFQFGELIFYTTSLTLAQRQQVEGYLAQKWGLQANLPAGHPGRTGVIYPHNLLIDTLITGQPTRKPFIRPLPNLTLPSNTITNGLIAYFLFNGTLLDSRNTITLSRTGSVSYVTGLRGQAIYLANETQSSNGTTAVNYLTSSYNVTVPFSVAVWFNPTNITRGSILSTVNSTGITGNSVTLYILGAGGGMSAAYTAVQNVGAYTSISVGTWYSAVITVNASNGLSLFVNGTQVGSTITQTPSINGLMIGNIQDNASSYAYSGYLEDYRFYNRILSGSEITSIYNGTG